MGFETFLDPVLGWVLTMPLWLGIAVLAFIITIIVNLIYKFVTDQSEMKRLKDDIKKFQAQMKENKDNHKKLMKIQAEAMQANSQYMMKSLKPTLFTFLPLIIIFAWMNANLAFDVVQPNEPIEIAVVLEGPAQLTLSGEGVTIEGEATKDTIESQASWEVSAPAGAYTLIVETQDGDTASHELLVGEKPQAKAEKQESPFKSSEIKYEKAKPFGDVSFLGYTPGWLFTYILFSIVFSVVSRKLMGIY